MKEMHYDKIKWDKTKRDEFIKIFDDAVCEWRREQKELCKEHPHPFEWLEVWRKPSDIINGWSLKESLDWWLKHYKVSVAQ